MLMPEFHHLDITFYHLKMSCLSLLLTHDIQDVIPVAYFSLVCEAVV